jgi:hypothetical protein
MMTRLFLMVFLLTGGLLGHGWCHPWADRARDTAVTAAETAVRPLLNRASADILPVARLHEDRSCHGLPWPPALTSCLTEGSQEMATRLPPSSQGAPYLTVIAASSLVLSRTGSPLLSLPPPGTNPHLAHIRTTVLLI